MDAGAGSLVRGVVLRTLGEGLHLAESVVDRVQDVVDRAQRMPAPASATFKVRADCEVSESWASASDRRRFISAFVASLRAQGRPAEVAGSLSDGEIAVWVSIEAPTVEEAVRLVAPILDRANAAATRVVESGQIDRVGVAAHRVKLTT